MSDQVAETGLRYMPGEVGSDVPEGYKQTEVGVIPEDWEVCELGESMTLQRGFDLPQRLRMAGSIPIVSSSGVSGRHSVAMVSAPGIVTGRYGTIGEIFYIEEPFWPLNTTLYVRDFKKVTPQYAYHFLRRVDFKSHSGKSGVPGVNRNDVHQELVSIPPDSEQTAIANALSNIDALISEQEKLIAKKQAIKTATMQQLLTGRTRLPQFALREDGSVKGYKQCESGEVPEDWEVTTIGACTSWMSGGTPSRGNEIFWSGSIPWISGSTLKSFELFTSDQFLSEIGVKSGSKMAPLGAVLLLVRGSALHNEIRAGVVIAPVAFNQDVKALVPSEALDSWYLTLYIKAMDGELLKLVSSAGNSAGVLDTELVKNFWLLLPSIVEQKSIAVVLTEMDKELKNLHNRLTKTRQIKQGMMQQLLTGQTRLIKPSVKESANV